MSLIELKKQIAIFCESFKIEQQHKQLFEKLSDDQLEKAFNINQPISKIQELVIPIEIVKLREQIFKQITSPNKIQVDGQKFIKDYKINTTHIPNNASDCLKLLATIDKAITKLQIQLNDEMIFTDLPFEQIMQNQQILLSDLFLCALNSSQKLQKQNAFKILQAYFYNKFQSMTQLVYLILDIYYQPVISGKHQMDQLQKKVKEGCIVFLRFLVENQFFQSHTDQFHFIIQQAALKTQELADVFQDYEYQHNETQLMSINQVNISNIQKLTNQITMKMYYYLKQINLFQYVVTQDVDNLNNLQAIVQLSDQLQNYILQTVKSKDDVNDFLELIEELLKLRNYHAVFITINTLKNEQLFEHVSQFLTQSKDKKLLNLINFKYLDEYQIKHMEYPQVPVLFQLLQQILNNLHDQHVFGEHYISNVNLLLDMLKKTEFISKKIQLNDYDIVYNAEIECQLW